MKLANRFELKYLVHQRQVPSLLEALGPRVVADPHARGPAGYPIYSVYCDSPRLDFFWEKVEGLKVRRKLRFRSYGTSDEVFLEIKQRVDRTLQKRRTPWPKARLDAAFFAGRLEDAEAAAARDPVAAEICVLWRGYDRRPTVGISYRRQAYFARDESDLRITLDSRVLYHVGALEAGRPPETGKHLLDPALAVLEIKYGDSVPLWLCEVVARLELRVVRLSKYCAAIDREHFRGELTLPEETATWTS